MTTLLRRTVASAFVGTILAAAGCGRVDYALGYDDAGPRDLGAPDIGADAVVTMVPCGPDGRGTAGMPCDGRFNPTDCDTLGRSIFVSDAITQRILRFTPETGEFHDDVRMSCNPTLYSLAVSRDAVAWAYDVFGHLWRIDLTTGDCEPDLERTFTFDSPGATLTRPDAKGTLTYVGDGPDVETERLLSMQVWSDRGSPAPTGAYGLMLSPIDTVSRRVSVGPYIAGQPDLSAMVGTGDGTLWAFRIPNESERAIVRIDQLTGATLESHDISAIGPRLWATDGDWARAIAFWGGRFYVFLQPTGEPSTSVYRFTPATGTSPSLIETIQLNTGYRISGAATSTCAPFEFI